MESTFIDDQSPSAPEETAISYPPSRSTTPPPPSYMACTTKKPQPPISVIFRKVEEAYAVGCDIDVCYTVLGGLEVTSRDWIGLYKVGWRSHHDYIYYDWSPYHEASSEEKEVEKKVVFAGSKMPKEDGDFYQFCYVASSGQVKGASTPFQFRVVSADDLVVEEERVCGGEDEGLMIVKTKKDLLHDQVVQTKLENVTINKKLMSMETKLEMAYEREFELKKCLDKVLESESAIKKLNEERMDQLSESRQQNEYLQGCIAGMQEKMDVLNQEKTSMERRLDDSDGYISSLQDKIKNLVVEKDLLQGKINSQVEENAAIKDYSKQLMLECEEKVNRMKMREVETSVQMVKCADDLKNMKSSMAYLSDKLQNSEDKLGAAEHCKKMLNEEVVALKDKLETFEMEMEEERKRKMAEEAERVKEIERKDVELKERDRQLEAINDQLREYDMKLGGSLVEKVKLQLGGLKSQLGEKEAQIEERNQRLDALMRQVEERGKVSEALRRELQQLEGCMFALETAHQVLLQRMQHKDACDDAKREEESKQRDLDMVRDKVFAGLNRPSPNEAESSSIVHIPSTDLGAADSLIREDSTADQSKIIELQQKVDFYKKFYLEEQRLNEKLKSKLTEQERLISLLNQKKERPNVSFQLREEFIDSAPTFVGEEERFVDALNDYSLVGGGDGGDDNDYSDNEAPNEGVLLGRNDVESVRSIRSCPFCPLVFEEGVSEVQMTSHVESHMVDDKPSCPICQLTFPDKHQLIMHTETHFE